MWQETLRPMVDPYRPDPPVHFPLTADENNLRLLSIFHYVAGGLIAVFSSIFIFHIVLGARMLAEPAGLFAPQSMSDGADFPGGPPSLGYVFLGAGSVALLVGWTTALLTVLAGRSLAQRRRHVFCTVVAALSCLWMPFGTLLGVFTLVVLTKPQVKAMFKRTEDERREGAGYVHGQI